jgi:hypothetical protein
MLNSDLVNTFFATIFAICAIKKTARNFHPVLKVFCDLRNKKAGGEFLLLNE